MDDLTFESLTFGDTPSSIHEESGSGDETLKTIPDDVDEAIEGTPFDEPQKRTTPRARTRSRKDSYTRREKARQQEAEKLDSHAILIGNLKLSSFDNLLAKFATCGPIKFSWFHKEHDFGFIQFSENVDVQKALELNRTDVDGCHITVERVARITPFKDPRQPLTQEPKNNTLCLKNLPFSLKEKELWEILTNANMKPQSIQYHYDSSKMFRGMAFVKYPTVEEAEKANEFISSLEIAGRLARVEYKRKGSSMSTSAAGETDEYEAPDEEFKRIYEQLQALKNNPFSGEIRFPTSFTNAQRKEVHKMAEKLGLQHVSEGEADQRFIKVFKKADEPEPRRRTSSAASSKAVPIQPGQRQRKTSSSNNTPGRYGSFEDKHHHGHVSSSFDKHHGHTSSSPMGSSYGSLSKSPGRSLDKYSSRTMSSSAPAPRKISLGFDIAPALSHPIRQPKGPDGTKGFKVQRTNSDIRKRAASNLNPNAAAFVIPRSTSLSGSAK
eukprot:Colp12_sorted_trinity150504_noHs@27559